MPFPFGFFSLLFEMFVNLGHSEVSHYTTLDAHWRFSYLTFIPPMSTTQGFLVTNFLLVHPVSFGFALVGNKLETF